MRSRFNFTPARCEMAAEQIGTGHPDGEVLGITGGKVAFYGGSPIEKATVNLSTTTTATTTALESSINAILVALKNLGLISSSAT